jgi:hypothetical protein
MSQEERQGLAAFLFHLLHLSACNTGLVEVNENEARKEKRHLLAPEESFNR